MCCVIHRSYGTSYGSIPGQVCCKGDSNSNSREDIANYPDFIINTLLCFRATIWYLATRHAIQDDQHPATTSVRRWTRRCCVYWAATAGRWEPHGKRKHEMQCHSRSNGDITDNRQGPEAWVNLHEPLPAGNPESFNVHCVATNQGNGASEAPRPGCCVVLYTVQVSQKNQRL